MNRAKPVVLALWMVAVAIGGASCGDDGGNTANTLPAIVTTTSTTTTIAVTTTVQRFYIIQRGDTLSKIATSFNVRVEDLMALNGISDPDKIEAGDELEIPQGVIVIDSLPDPPTTTTTTL